MYKKNRPGFGRSILTKLNYFLLTAKSLFRLVPKRVNKGVINNSDGFILHSFFRSVNYKPVEKYVNVKTGFKSDCYYSWFVMNQG